MGDGICLKAPHCDIGTGYCPCVMADGAVAFSDDGHCVGCDRTFRDCEVAPRVVKCARAYLGWTQADLAEKAGIGVSTVADFEREARRTESAALEAMRLAFVEAGIQILPHGILIIAEVKP